MKCGKEASYGDFPVFIGALDGYESVEGSIIMKLNIDKATKFNVIHGDMCEEHYIEFCRRNLK